jgi:hypothetical protein
MWMNEREHTHCPELKLTLSARDWRALREQERRESAHFRAQLKRDNEHFRAMVRRDNELFRAHLRQHDTDLFGPGGFLPALREPTWLREIRTALDGFSSGVTKWLDETREARERVAENVFNFLMELPDLAQRAQEALASRFSPNWRDLTADELHDATALAMNKGVCLVWAPRVEIVRELLAATDDADLEARLLRHQREILDDVDAQLDEVSHPRLAELEDHAKEAVATFRDQGPRPAQAHATILLTSVVNVTFEIKRFREAFERWQEYDPMAVPLGEFRFRIIFWAFARALQRTDLAGPGFNRHASVGHTRLSEQYTPTNAFAAILLLGAVLRELHWLFTALDEADAQKAAA